MKNVTCRKLLIDRSKAPEKLGTLKDISLFGSFEFPTSGPHNGGLIAHSLAGIGKELKKKPNSSSKVLPIAHVPSQVQLVLLHLTKFLSCKKQRVRDKVEVMRFTVSVLCNMRWSTKGIQILPRLSALIRTS